jgi:hypothetical protein
MQKTPTDGSLTLWIEGIVLRSVHFFGDKPGGLITRSGEVILLDEFIV